MPCSRCPLDLQETVPRAGASARPPPHAARSPLRDPRAPGVRSVAVHPEVRAGLRSLPPPAVRRRRRQADSLGLRSSGLPQTSMGPAWSRVDTGFYFPFTQTRGDKAKAKAVVSAQTFIKKSKFIKKHGQKSEHTTH